MFLRSSHSEPVLSPLKLVRMGDHKGRPYYGRAWGGAGIAYILHSPAKSYNDYGKVKCLISKGSMYR
jgi:hypothetical protein